MTLSPKLAEACRVADISLEDLRSTSKLKRLTDKRAVAYHYLCVVRGMSWPSAARLVRRDHSTLIYGAQKHSHEAYGTRPKATTQEMRDAFEAKEAAALKACPWVQAYDLNTQPAKETADV